MIPHQLQLKNFLSYGATVQTIDFDPYHLIYLSGKNGHGKSALLEALTWVIWGSARKTLTSVKPDQGLIRLGQTHMMIIGEFSCNNQRYKIRREVTIQNNKTQLQLEFGLLDSHKNQWIALTEKTTKDTQEKIESVIGLSYESFINSAFLKQGSANEFSKKSAKDRKEIFSAILGLGLYDTIRTKALQKIKIEQTRMATLDTFISKIDQTLLLQKDTELAYQKIQIERALAQEKMHAITDEYTNKEREYTHIQGQWNEHNQIQEKKLKVTHELQTISTDIKKNYAMLKKEQKNNPLHSLQHYLKQQKKLMDELEEQQKLLSNRMEIQKKTIAIETLLNQAITSKNSQTNELNQLSNGLIQLSLQKNNCAEQLKKIPSLQEHASIEVEYNRLDLKKKFLEKCLEQRKTIYQTLIAKRNHQTVILTQIHDKKNMISNQDGKDPACPLCSQNLSINRKKFLQTTLEKEELIAQKILEKIKKLLPFLKEKIILLHEKTVLIQTQVSEKKQLLQSCSLGRQQEPTLLQEQDMLQKKEQALCTIIEQEKSTMLITWEDPTSEFQKNKSLKKTLIEALNQIPYEEEKHKKLQKELLHINELLTHYERISKDFKNKRETLLSLCMQAKNIKRDLISIKKNLDHTIKERFKQCEQALTAIKQKMHVLHQQKDLYDHRFFELKTTLTHYETLQKEKNTIAQEKELIFYAIRDYQTIAHATGKDGLQALLIEEAIPDIEQDANILLSKLTNNQTQLFIESLKDLKNGGTKETLDIKISDSMGIRPYEMFSGGEAFRIDLALRIAISKLLAKRAGTALQTLIIDEGFGSQDEDGLAAIMDAMYKIQDDFEKIIVVSHLPAMKDQFPVHFIVEKTPQGSTIQIKELC